MSCILAVLVSGVFHLQKYKSAKHEVASLKCGARESFVHILKRAGTPALASQASSQLMAALVVLVPEIDSEHGG